MILLALHSSTSSGFCHGEKQIGFLFNDLLLGLVISVFLQIRISDIESLYKYYFDLVNM